MEWTEFSNRLHEMSDELDELLGFIEEKLRNDKSDSLRGKERQVTRGKMAVALENLIDKVRKANKEIEPYAMFDRISSKDPKKLTVDEIAFLFKLAGERIGEIVTDKLW